MQTLIKTLGISLLLIAAGGVGYGRERAWGNCERGNYTAQVTSTLNTSTSTPLMRSFPGCTVTVYLTGTLTLATLYGDNSGTPKANPFVGDASGYWFFYADQGRYDVRLSGGGITSPFTLGDISLLDASVTPVYPVTSVFGRTGAVTAQTGDYSFSQIGGTNIVPQGGTGATSLTGILQGNGVNPFTAVAAATMLGYLRRKPNVTGTVYEFSNPPALYSNDYGWTQTPGGSVSIGVNLITLTPCPLGIAGTVLNTYLYLSAGTGTAEAVLISGGSCTSGAASGTIGFTAANTHTGAWTIASASAGIKEAMNLLPANGGVVYLPTGTITLQATLVVGQGTPTLESQTNGISLIGQGSGRADTIAFPTGGATNIVWGGIPGGTVIRVAGPIGNVTLRDFRIDSATAAIGLDIAHSYYSNYRNLMIAGWTSIGLRSQAIDYNFAAMAEGNNHNIFDTVSVVYGTGGAGQIACQFGQAVANVLSPFDYASNTFINGICNGGLGVGIDLRFADSNTFISTWMIGTVAGVRFTEVPGTGGFPGSNVFLHSLAGGPTIGVPSNYIPVVTNSFFPYAEEGTVTPLGSMNTFATGITYQGHWFGRVKNAPLRYSTSTSSAAIANTTAETAFAKSYVLSANELNLAGTVLRVRGAGRLSTTGTPQMTFRVKMGATPVGTFILTCANNSSNAGFSVDSSFTIQTIGSSGTILIGPSQGHVYNPLTLVQFGPVGSFTVGQQALNLTTSQTITITAQWGTASASNTAVLDTMSVDLAYAGTVQ